MKLSELITRLQEAQMLYSKGCDPVVHLMRPAEDWPEEDLVVVSDVDVFEVEYDDENKTLSACCVILSRGERAGDLLARPEGLT